jgi:glucokinase
MKTMGKQEHLYVGVDLGGTKIQSSLVYESGTILGSVRTPTPANGTPDDIIATIETSILDLLAKQDVDAADLEAIGIAVPGVVDPPKGRVIVTPNINFSDVNVVRPLKKTFDVPVVLGNDCNLGTLGEFWLGAARGANSAVGILVGTGIGGGFVCSKKGKLWRGARESALEIGHMIMQIGGPVCGCGNQGCFEALASRSAMERQIRQEVEQGTQTVLTKILNGDLQRIRSKAFKQALKREDPLVTKVVRQASQVLGYGCMTIRHLIDPEVIVLGGGVMEACGDFILPIVQEVVASDKLPGAKQGGDVVMSALADDAVVLGAVALARQ